MTCYGTCHKLLRIHHVGIPQIAEIGLLCPDLGMFEGFVRLETNDIIDSELQFPEVLLSYGEV